MSKPKMTPEQIKRAQSALEAGCSNGEVASRFGVTAMTLARWVPYRKHGPRATVSK